MVIHLQKNNKNEKIIKDFDFSIYVYSISSQCAFASIDDDNENESSVEMSYTGGLSLGLGHGPRRSAPNIPVCPCIVYIDDMKTYLKFDNSEVNEYTEFQIQNSESEIVQTGHLGPNEKCKISINYLPFGLCSIKITISGKCYRGFISR